MIIKSLLVLSLLISPWPQSGERREQIKDLIGKSDLVVVAVGNSARPVIDKIKYRQERQRDPALDPSRMQRYMLGVTYQMTVREVIYVKPEKDASKQITWHAEDPLPVYAPGPLADSLFRNNGDGTFTDVSNQAGVADKEGLFGLGVAWCDFNEDGYIDLYVANDTGANYLYQNKGDGTFSEIGLMSGAALSEDGKGQASMGVAIGDYDHRGRWNIFVTNFSDEYNAFYRHEKGSTFTDVSYATQTGRASLPYVGWGCGFFDYDNDGWLDLLAVNGHVYPQLAMAKRKIAYAQRKLLYRNNRNGTFAEIGAEAGSAMNEPSVSRGAAFGDLDNDGDVDVVINNLDGAPTILRNDGGHRNNFLALELIGGKSNRDAYGAGAKVIAGDLVQIGEKRSGGSYLSQNDARLHFGLELRAKVDAVEVRWPSGVTQKFVNLPVNSFIRIKEGDPAYNLIPRRER
jgi:hypothetical protein